MISDFVKGKKKFDYPPAIQKGIMLHRFIDTFTDNHEATKKAKEVFRPAYRLYSGALIDVLYDYFLATDKTEFDDHSLLDFSKNVYTVLENNTQWLPERFARMFPYMKQHNWLYNYRTKEGINKSLGGVVKRALYLEESETAFRLFEENHDMLREYYLQFWKDLKPFALNEYALLQPNIP